MKKTWLVAALILVLAILIFVFRDPILDFLPIDQSRWVERDGQRYLLDEDGDPRVGWFNDGTADYYFLEDGAMHTGWLEIDTGRYHFGSDGKRSSGWVTLEGTQHYFNDQGQPMAGLLEEGGKRFFLDENGTPLSGWQTVGDKLCYIQENGIIPSGWLEDNGSRYFLSDRGFIHTGWLDTAQGRFYFAADGIMATGWLNMDGNSYYMDENGAMTSGWAELEGKTYYFREDGTRHSGWLELEGQRYFFDASGAMHTGWLTDGEYEFYLTEDGTPAQGRLEIDGEVFYFTSRGAKVLLINRWNTVDEGYEPEELVTSAYGALMTPEAAAAVDRMIADCIAAGHKPYLRTSYRNFSFQRALLQNKIAEGYSYDQAIQIVAIPGTSEHHTGLAIDIVDNGYRNMNYNQENTETTKWLMANCWDYGFIVRYPNATTDVTGIIYEPWHYRYVGLELAQELKELGVCLETYLDNLTGDGSTCGGKYIPMD